MQIDLVTTCFLGEIGLLALQARSISKYADPDFIRRIFIINNDKNPGNFCNRFFDEVYPEYGYFCSKIVLLDVRQMGLPKQIIHDGWRSQQLIKLLAHKFVETDFYCLLDAKNHLVKPFSSGLVCPHGKPISFKANQWQEMLRLMKESCKYFWVDFPDDMIGMPAITPYFLSRNVVSRMMSYVEWREHTNFGEFFSNKKDVTEFFLYYAYMRYSGINFEEMYDFSNGQFVATLFNGWPEDGVDAINMINKTKQRGYYFLGIHRNRFASMGNETREALAETWIDAGLMTSKEAGLRFIAAEEKELGSGKLG